MYLMCLSQVVTKELTDCAEEPFWMSSSDCEEIYQQMSANKASFSLCAQPLCHCVSFYLSIFYGVCFMYAPINTSSLDTELKETKLIQTPFK